MPAPLDVVSDGAPTWHVPVQATAQMCAHPWTNDRPLPMPTPTAGREPLDGRAQGTCEPSSVSLGREPLRHRSAAPFLGSPLPEWRTPMSCRRRAVLHRTTVTVHHNLQASCITCIRSAQVQITDQDVRSHAPTSFAHTLAQHFQEQTIYGPTPPTVSKLSGGGQKRRGDGHTDSCERSRLKEETGGAAGAL